MSHLVNIECECGSGVELGNCCQPYLDLKMVADTAECLMRSRYTAFVRLNDEYLRLTWAKGQCPQPLILDADSKWIKLEIISSSLGQLKDETGKVEFKAWFIHDNKLVCLHEISDFIREKGRWVYLKGRLFDEPVISLSMNQLCPCGSGKKYKRCCF